MEIVAMLIAALLAIIISGVVFGIVFVIFGLVLYCTICIMMGINPWEEFKND